MLSAERHDGDKAPSLCAFQQFERFRVAAPLKEVPELRVDF
jgi:hypothetical protein